MWRVPPKLKKAVPFLPNALPSSLAQSSSDGRLKICWLLLLLLSLSILTKDALTTNRLRSLRQTRSPAFCLAALLSHPTSTNTHAAHKKTKKTKRQVLFFKSTVVPVLAKRCRHQS